MRFVRRLQILAPALLLVAIAVAAERGAMPTRLGMEPAGAVQATPWSSVEPGRSASAAARYAAPAPPAVSNGFSAVRAAIRFSAHL